MVRGALTRVACFLAFWIAIAGPGTVDLIVGALAAVVASWVSLRLLPPASRRVSLAAVGAFVPRFLYQSVVAGVDVAWRALAPRLRLQPGFVIYPPHLHPARRKAHFAQSQACFRGPCRPGAMRTEISSFIVSMSLSRLLSSSDARRLC
jgi:multicomponent Na+:H+ antiporter subunit E